MHICIGNLTIIGSDNGLSPDLHQAIIWTNAEILLIGPFGANLSKILIEIHTFSFRKIHLKNSSGKWQPFCLGLNVLMAERVTGCPIYGTTSTARFYFKYANHWWNKSRIIFQFQQLTCSNNKSFSRHQKVFKHNFQIVAQKSIL